MARPKKELKEVNIEQLGMEEIEEINIQDFPEIPSAEEIPMPQEPSVEEQINMATKELEQKNNDLIQQLYYKEQEVAQLRKALEDQENYFNKIAGRTLIALLGDK